MYIHQYLLDILEKSVRPGKVVLIYGPRRTGKTTLIKKYLETQKNYLFVSGEDIHIQAHLSSQSIEKLKLFVGKHSLLVIDEAQAIHNIGLNLKLLVDHCPNLSIIATGSASLALADQVGEPLTGRQIILKMFPLSQIELSERENLAQTQAYLEERLLYGSYPDVILEKNIQEKKSYLLELVSSYLYKDILILDNIKKPKKIIQLLQMLAFQIGKDVSLSEIGQQIGLNKMTVERYLDLLEKAFVIINLQGFSKNLRKEITKQSRYYFYDVGIRNGIINQFNPLSSRDDVGALWENYIIMERIKKQSYHKIHSNNYFWRTYDQQEIDWIEAHDNELHAYEFKWKLSKKIKAPTAWANAYPDATFQVLHQDNYLNFIT